MHLLGIMKQAVTFTPPLGWLIDHDRMYIGYKVVNTSGSTMEQRTASKPPAEMCQMD